MELAYSVAVMCGIIIAVILAMKKNAIISYLKTLREAKIADDMQAPQVIISDDGMNDTVGSNMCVPEA